MKTWQAALKTFNRKVAQLRRYKAAWDEQVAKGLRHCCYCHEWKPNESFQLRPDRVDHLHYACRPCIQAVADAWNKAHSHRRCEIVTRWKLRNPLKHAEHVRRDREKKLEKRRLAKAEKERQKNDSN